MALSFKYMVSGHSAFTWHGGLHTLADTDAKSVFRFSRGARVVSHVGGGRILEGYASGKIIQYEIEGPNGERFMASEHELKLQ
jgi:hypothetical protein